MNRILAGTTGKVLVTVGVVGVVGGMAGLGTFGTFTSTTSASHSIANGTITLALGASGTGNRLSVNASGVLAGDTIQRAFDLSNSGSANMASITLTTTASPSSLLDTDVTNGLQMVVDKCSTAWTEGGTPPAYTYTCGGTITPILTTRPVIQNLASLTSLAALTAGGSDHMRVTLTLPSSAGNTFQGISDTLTYSFVGTQRNALSD